LMTLCMLSIVAGSICSSFLAGIMKETIALVVCAIATPVKIT